MVFSVSHLRDGFTLLALLTSEYLHTSGCDAVAWSIVVAYITVVRRFERDLICNFACSNVYSKCSICKSDSDEMSKQAVITNCCNHWNICSK